MQKKIPKDMDSMKGVDIRMVDKDQLVDLNSVRIDESQPVSSRIASFVEQIGNPYCFRIGDVAVKVKYRANGPTFQQNMEDILRTM